MADLKAWLLTLLGIMLFASIVIPAYVVLTKDNDAHFHAELESVQTAMNAMMYENKLTRVNGNTKGPAVNDWTTYPTGPGEVALRKYLRTDPTNYYYCWDSEGAVWPRNDPGKHPSRKFAENAGDCNPLP